MKIVVGVLVVILAVPAVGWIGTRLVLHDLIGSAVTGTVGDCSPANPSRLSARAPTYVGPLFDTHIHAPLLVVPPKPLMQALPFDGTLASLKHDASVDDIVCLLEQEGSIGAIVFFTLSRFIFDDSVAVARRAAEQYPDQLVPFVMPAPLPGLAPDFSADRLDGVFAGSDGLLRGIGELTFYSDYFQRRGIEPDDSAWLDLYRVAGKHDAVVMMHTTFGQEEALAKIFARNPEVNFILHSDEVREILPELLAAYPNVYYTLDTSVITSVFNDEIKNKEQFIADMELHRDDYMAQALSWKRMMEQYPDQFLWGTDRALIWHFDPEVSALLAQFSREFIGQLDPTVQERYAFRNAEKLFAR